MRTFAFEKRYEETTSELERKLSSCGCFHKQGIEPPLAVAGAFPCHSSEPIPS